VKRFFDTNILVYAYSNDERQVIAASLLKQTLHNSGVISVQVLNELTHVFLRKMRLSWDDIEKALANVTKIFGPAASITQATHEAALRLSRQHGLSIYDALIIAAAIEAGCDELLSEDMQHERKFGSLTIINPFLTI
jgi:predicted nucleic acid-binding protein